MGSRDRPHREAKKKPKDKLGQPKLSRAFGAAAPAGGADPEAAQAEGGRGGDRRELSPGPRPVARPVGWSTVATGA